MLLKDNKQFRLPALMAGSFKNLDRLEIPHDTLILKDVLQREDNGDIELVCQAKDGPEEKRGKIVFLVDNHAQKDVLYRWFRQQIGKDIKTIYHSGFSFGAKNL